MKSTFFTGPPSRGLLARGLLRHRPPAGPCSTSWETPRNDPKPFSPLDRPARASSSHRGIDRGRDAACHAGAKPGQPLLPFVGIGEGGHQRTSPNGRTGTSAAPSGTIAAMRRSLAWLSALPLMLAGSQAAHVLAYRWVFPSSQMRLHELLSTGHGYMDRLPMVLGVTGAVALISLLVGVADAARGRRLRGLPAWAFALLPLTAFVLQEILERSVDTGTFVWQAVESPTFVPGLALQLPFAAVAYVAARLLL